MIEQAQQIEFWNKIYKANKDSYKAANNTRKTNSKSEDINEENTFVNSSKDILGDLKLIQSNSDNSTVGVSTKDSMASIRPK